MKYIIDLVKLTPNNNTEDVWKLAILHRFDSISQWERHDGQQMITELGLRGSVAYAFKANTKKACIEYAQSMYYSKIVEVR